MLTSIQTPPLLSFSDLNQLFRDFLPEYEHNLKSETFPPCQEKVVGDTLVYQFALAGYTQDKLKIEAGEDYIIVNGDKLNDETLLYAGRKFIWTRKDTGGYWDFQKSNVEFKNGLLTIKVPKKEEKKTKLLEIKIG